MELVDERISRVRGLLRVFPDETFPSSECLMFQDELFYNALCKYVSKWCKGFGLPSEVIGEEWGCMCRQSDEWALGGVIQESR